MMGPHAALPAGTSPVGRLTPSAAGGHEADCNRGKLGVAALMYEGASRCAAGGGLAGGDACRLRLPARRLGSLKPYDGSRPGPLPRAGEFVGCSRRSSERLRDVAALASGS